MQADSALIHLMYESLFDSFFFFFNQTTKTKTQSGNEGKEGQGGKHPHLAKKPEL